MSDITGLVAALRSYGQADEDGVMCIVSRQACEEAADELERLTATLCKARADGMKEAVEILSKSSSYSSGEADRGWRIREALRIRADQIEQGLA